MLETIRVNHDFIQLLDQRRLPFHTEYIDIRTVEDAHSAIRDMIVRGAPAIGVTASFGITFALRGKNRFSARDFGLAKEYLISARPTAVNLSWALNMQERRYKSLKTDKVEEIFEILFRNAERMYSDDIAINKKIGEYGQSLIEPGSKIITHCNAGALATCGWGTALGVIRSAFQRGKVEMVYADETRPYLQGSRLTAWELNQDKIPVKVITDSSSAYIMKKHRISCAVVGADRIAMNGDTANKIGTYLLAINCRFHNVPFYVAAPISTFDPEISEGNMIVIEERDKDEIRKAQEYRIIPEYIDAENPSFDITPHNLISAFITEKGVFTGREIRDILKA